MVQLTQDRKGRKDVIRCPKDSLGETQEIGRVRLKPDAMAY